MVSYSMVVTPVPQRIKNLRPQRALITLVLGSGVRGTTNPSPRAHSGQRQRDLLRAHRFVNHKGLA
jgi:hypothetical protein